MGDPNNQDDEDLNDAPLPKGWVRGYSRSQQRYYYSHGSTKTTQWHFPTASEVADPQKAKRRAEEAKQREHGKGSAAASAPKPSAPPSKKRKTSPDAFLDLADTTNVAIIVPYRDLHVEQNRAKHLAKFVPHMNQFFAKLKKQHKVSNHHVYIMDQSDDGRKFNRGKLLNIGFELARKSGRKHDVFIFHDVDLLPQDDLLDAYSHFPKTPYHIARVWKRYSNNPKYMGGVVSFSSSDYRRINGFPNTFWGWGGEDDEMQLRCTKLGMSWEYPSSGTLVDLEEMDLHQKLSFLKQHKEWKCMVKWEALNEHETTWKANGLADLKYQVLKQVPLDGNDARTSHATKITVDVQLNGGHWANTKCAVDFMGDWNKK